jgi:hypothetical protein
MERRRRSDRNDAETGLDSVSFILQTGKLSLAALEELRRRVKAGENEVKVKVELLLMEEKGVRG